MYKHFALTGAILGIATLLGTSMVSAQMSTDAPQLPPDAPQTTTQAPGGNTGSGIRRGITQQNNSGQIGDVTIYPRGDKSFVVVRIEGFPPEHIEPAHFHRGHDCLAIDPKPAFALNPVINGRSETLVSVSVDRLFSGNYVINLHQSAANLKHYVACGELTPGT